MVCCLHPEFIGIPSNPFFWNLPNSIGSNKIPNYDGSQLDRGSFHKMLCLFPPPNTPSCSLQPKSSSSSVCRTCSQNASVLTGWFFASFWCWILWPGCSRGFLSRFFHEGHICAGVAEQLDSVPQLCLPHLPGGLLQPNGGSDLL